MAGTSFDVPTVLTAEELIEKTFHRAYKITKTGTNVLDGKKKTTIAKITASGDIVTTTLGTYVNKFPRMEKGEDFVPELVDLIIGIDRYKKALGACNWASNRTEKLKNEALKDVRHTKDPTIIESIRKSFYGRLSSYINQIADDLLFLQETKNKFRQLPTIDPDVATAVVAGFPNVGKSKLVTVLSTASPEIAPYPFTTKGLIIGHIEDDWRKFQIIDTPGLLDRSFEDRNDIEKQAVLALRYLTDIMIFVIDPSESCGYSMTKQNELLAAIRRGFEGVPILVVESKADLKRTDSDNIHLSAETGEGMEEFRTTVLKLLRKIGREKAVAVEGGE